MVEQSRARHLMPWEGRAFRGRGNTIVFKVTGADTGDAYSLSEVWVDPGAGVPPHIENLYDELLVVLEGSFRIDVAGTVRDCGPGEAVFVPRGTPHSIYNAGPVRGRGLGIQSPGGLFERYAEEAWEAIPDPRTPPPESAPPDFAKVASAAARYGIEMVGGPLPGSRG
jgi:mannose-6-phosphate isomerase-like protein (cupin superfamily)